MKKLFGISFAFIAFLLVLAVQTGYSTPLLVDDDVGITYVITDQHQSTSLIIAPVATIGESRYSCTQELLRIPGIDVNIEMEATYGTCYVDNKECQYWQRSANNITIDLKRNTNVPANTITRLDIGENCNWQNIT